MSNALCKTNREIPQDMILGNLVFMNLTDMKIPERDLVNIFTANNIPEYYVRRISPADAYRRATSYEKGKTITIVDGNGNTINVKVEVDEVKCDVDTIKRIIGIKRVDQLNEDIAYEPIAEVIFDRDHNTCNSLLRVSAASDPNAQVYSQICEEIEDNYREWSVYHNKATVRNIINRIVEDTNPVNLMPTGLCKFTPSTSADLIYGLQSALGEMSAYAISNTRGNIMEIIPVIDTAEQRELVEKNLTAEVTDELASFVTELKQVLTTKQTLPTRTANAYVEKFKFLEAKVRDYEQLLGIYINSLGVQLIDALKLVNDNKESDN